MSNNLYTELDGIEVDGIPVKFDAAKVLTNVEEVFVVDPTLTIQGAAADAKKTGDEIGALKEDLSSAGLEKCKIEDALINANGEIEYARAWDVYVYMCSECGRISMSVGQNSEMLVYGFFTDFPQVGDTTYNHARTVVSGLNADNVTVPNGVKWVAVRSAKTDIPTLQLGHVNDITKAVLVEKVQRTGSANDVVNQPSVIYMTSDVADLPTNSDYLVQTIGLDGSIQQIATRVSGAYRGSIYHRSYVRATTTWSEWVHNSGELNKNYEVVTTYSGGVVYSGGVNENNNVSHSDYIEIEPFNVYRIDNIYRNDNNIIIYYNANKEYVMSEKLPRQLSQTISSFVFSVPQNVAYMRFNVTNSNLSKVKITRIVNAEINDVPIYLGTFTAGYINANNKVVESATLSYSDYINVTYGKTLVVKKAYPQSVRMIFMYDADKNYIGSININVTGSSVAEFLFTVPYTCAYIRFNVTNGNTSSVSLAYRVSTYTESHNESSVFVNDFLKTVGAKINKPFATMKSAGPLCVIIDDDTSSMYQVDKFHDLCEQNAVVGVYACITSYLDSITGLEAKLLNYEKEGFQTIVHCTQQTRIYDPTNEMYSVSAMENDFIGACHRMHEAGFYDWKYWAYPYGSFTNEHIRIARKTGMKCAMTVPNLEYIGFTDAVTDIRGRYTMKRMELYPTDAAGNQTLSDIKNQMDLCAKNGGLLIICTHMYQWDEQSDFTRFDEMVQYGKSKGLRFTTIGEAMSYWEHLYDLYEAF